MSPLYSFNPGLLEVFYGPMKSGKSEAIIDRLKNIKGSFRLPFYNINHIAFKPDNDNRTFEKIVTRSRDCISAIELPFNYPLNALNYINEFHDVVIFDEAELFGESIVGLIEKLLDQKKNVLVSGLDTDFRSEPFGMMDKIISMAHIKYGLTARCDYKIMSDEMSDEGKIIDCKNPATRTQRLIKGMPAPYNDELIIIGDKTCTNDESRSYEARCLEHYILPE